MESPTSSLSPQREIDDRSADIVYRHHMEEPRKVGGNGSGLQEPLNAQPYKITGLTSAVFLVSGDQIDPVNGDRQTTPLSKTNHLLCNPLALQVAARQSLSWTGRIIY